MQMKQLLTLVAVLTIVLGAVSQCHAAPVNVFAAASLKEAFTQIGAAYQKVHAGEQVHFNFAGTPTLRTQIQQGAPADVFASADRPNMDAIATLHLVCIPQVFARNTLVIVTPPDHPVVCFIEDLANKRVKMVLADSNVPVGHYAEEVLAKMTPTIAQDFKQRVIGNVVSRETDVKAVLAKVQLGEADAGIVFATDARAAGNTVHAIAIPAQYNVVGEYPIALVTGSANAPGGTRFIAFVMSPEGQAILHEHGFLGVAGGAK